MLVVCVLTESRDALSAQRSGENEVGCIHGEQVSVGTVPTDWSCFCVQLNSLSYYTWHE